MTDGPVNQEHIAADGDVAAHDINRVTINYPTEARATLLRRLSERYAEEVASGTTIGKTIEALKLFLECMDGDGDIIGLDAKLKTAGWEDKLHEALRYKEFANKQLMENSLYESAQQIYACVMAMMQTLFRSKVLPIIESRGQRAAIEAALHAEVIQPVFAALEDNPLTMTQAQLLGLIYLLTGNCHIRWHPGRA